MGPLLPFFVGGEVTPDLTSFATDPAAAKTLALMRDGKWRKARDAAKDLCKKDRERYTPLLIEANAGLAREMIGKGLAKDAATVIEYLATIAPPERVAALRAELEKPADQAVAPAAGGGEIHWTVVLGAAAGEISDKDFGSIDALVSDGYRPPDGAGEASDRLAAELAAVRTACAATGDGRWDEARDALRALPRDSVFRHWRMFLRGARCVFEDDRETARKCFADLPPDGALARAARVLDPALVPPGPAAPVGAKIPFFLATSGQPANWAAPLGDAETLWKSGKRHQAFAELRKGLKSAFPDDRPGLASALTDAMMPFRRKMKDADFEDGASLVRWANKLGMPAELLLTVLRPAIVADPDAQNMRMMEDEWAAILLELSRRDGVDLQRDAVGWQWFGEMALRMASFDDDEDWGVEDWDDDDEDDDEDDDLDESDLRIARKAFEKSVKCDPENADAWLALLDLISKSGDTQEHNRVLGEVAKRFPEDKRILLLAGREALKRKTYTKALKSLETALEHDPLDREIKTMMVSALVGQAQEYRKKKKSSAAVWERMEPLLEDRPAGGGMALVRWVARVRQGLLDTDKSAAKAAMADAERLAPTQAERLVLEELFRSLLKLPRRKALDADWQAALSEAALGWLAFPRFLELADLDLTAEMKFAGAGLRFALRMLQAVDALLERRSAADLEELLTFLEAARNIAAGRGKHIRYLLEKIVNALMRALEEDSRKSRKPQDPRLRLAHLLGLEITGQNKYMSPDQFGQCVDSVVRDAKSAGLDRTVMLANGVRERLLGGVTYEADYDNDDDFDDDDDDFDDEDFDDGFGSGPLDPEIVRRAIAEELGAVPPDLAKILAQAVEALQRGGRMPGGTKKPDKIKPPAKKAAKKATKKQPVKQAEKKRPEPPAQDTNQMDLF